MIPLGSLGSTGMKNGTRVKVLGGMMEFVGSEGTVVDREKDGPVTMYRVRLDVPVNVPGVGWVADDLWAKEYLRKVGR